MQLALFYVFAFLMLLFGVGVVAMRNPVSSALCLVMSFVALAALFVTLDAFFIGVIQVLVYAGAVMVLFLFIIMLLNLRDEQTRRLNFAALAGGFLVVVGFVSALFQVISSTPGLHFPMPAITGPTGKLAWVGASDVALVGVVLFKDYWFPLQIVGLLLLVATIGVVMLSKKELK